MVDAVYFDGQVAKDHAVTLQMGDQHLLFVGEEIVQQTWSLAGLHPVDAPAPDQPFRLTHHDYPGARLVVRDRPFIDSLIARQPRLRGGVTKKQVFNVGAWIVAGFAALVILGYAVLTLLPHRLAAVLPDEWRNRMGAQIEKALVEDAKQCLNPAGVSALGAMVASIAEGADDLPAMVVKVYDIPILNAFAAPGDRIIITRELISAASAADEVAGVLAHEMGHVVHRDSEAQLVRVTGLQVLMSVATGTSGGNTISSVAGLASILQYSREAERAADEFALATLTGARIDPMGFKRFFEKVLALEGKTGSGPLAKIGGMFSTHPGTEDRIKQIEPLPDGIVARPPLTVAQWQALQKICD